MAQYIMHIDMDAFYASVEQLDNPELQGKPVIVGGRTERGVVSAASYEARAFGVRSAMPIAEALRRCPQAVLVQGHMQRYAQLSTLIHQTLMDFSPLVEMASIDEAYLDATGLERLFGPIYNMAELIQNKIYAVTNGLSCSVGAAPIKFLAKICSDINKPHGIYILKAEQIAEFINYLPVQKVPGVGRKFHQELQKIGIEFLGQVVNLPANFWEERFGKMGLHLYHCAQGQDNRKVEPYSPIKSESAENTLPKDTLDLEILHSCLFSHAERVGRRLRKHKLAGRTISLKVKYSDFKQITRQSSLNSPTCSTQTIYETACNLLKELNLIQPVRLIGLGVSGFDQHPRQRLLPIFESEQTEEKRTKLDHTLDKLTNRYGNKAIVRGRSYDIK